MHKNETDSQGRQGKRESGGDREKKKERIGNVFGGQQTLQETVETSRTKLYAKQGRESISRRAQVKDEENGALY